MPTRILLRLFFLAGLAAPWCAFALGVGQLEVRSALDQIFEAELPLIINNPTELTGLTARIPRQEEFDRAGVERLEFLSKLRFSVQTPPGGPNIVKITSLEPIREPNFNVLLELVWSRGRLIREFTVQLDPQLYANRRQPPAPPPVVVPLPPVVAPPAAPPTVPQLPPAPPVSFEGASFYGPVKSGETLAAIANRVRPSSAAISVPQMMAILIAGNPTAFANGNPNTLRSGATLKVPTPQALGASATPMAAAPTPPSAGPPATAPTTAGPAIAAALPPSTAPPPPAAEPPAAPPPPPAAPTSPAAEPVTAGSSALPPPITTKPLPVTPAAEMEPPPTTPSPVAGPSSAPPSLPAAESLREIVPQSTVPQPETPPAPLPAPAAAVAPAAAPAPATPPAPPPAPVAKPKPPAPPVEAESSWMSNPVVWVAIALILLAIAALIVLPLLRRPGRTKPSGAEEVAVLESTETLPAVSETEEGPAARTRLREPGSVRPRPAAKLAAVPPAVPAREEAAPSPAGPSAPKPIGELLKDFDFSLGEGGKLPAAAPPGMASARNIKAPLLEAEPPTASVTRHPTSPLAAVPADLAEQEKQKQAPAQPAMELPSELRLDGLNFDLDDLGLGKAARPQPSELPPLEMKPGSGGARKLSEPSLVERSIAEPPTESSSPAPTVAVPTDSPKPGLKFEFADVTQDLAKSGLQEPLKLDEALQDLGGDTLKLDSRKEVVSGLAGGISAADYVETKLDLASAYLEMGDQVGARSLLDEVLREGNTTQKERARAFLNKLG